MCSEGSVTQESIRVLVVDDTSVYRMAVAKVLEESPGIEVIGTACNGKMALSEIERLRPDVITLDLEMPELDGLGVLQALKTAGNPLGVIMLSAFTDTGAQATVSALELGAFDFVLKPQSRSIHESEESIRRELIPKIEAYIESVRPGRTRKEKPTPKPALQSPISAEPPSVTERMAHVAEGERFAPQVVAVGISTGGPDALARMMPKLPGDLEVPVLSAVQLSREPSGQDRRGSRPPTLAHFRDSGAIEQDCDIALLIHQASSGGAIEDGPVDLLIAKQRNGWTGTVPLQWNGTCARFEEPGADEEGAA